MALEFLNVGESMIGSRGRVLERARGIFLG